MTVLTELQTVLKKDKRLVKDDELLVNTAVELALKTDKDLIKLLLSEKDIKKHFFVEVEGALVFNREKFIEFITTEKFLPDSYTKFKQNVGLATDGDYLAKRGEVVLVWPYKDCILEGGQEKEDEKRREIFYNETLAPDEVDRLLDPKVLTDFKRIDVKGEHKVKEVKQNYNLILKGNNLLALHSLAKRFAGRIKLIYIDPPYNMGSDSFKYNDNFNHSSWLTFMKNRLEVARELLSKDGAIFVQIDHHELGYINVLMDEIFLRENKVQVISVKTASPAGFKTVNPGPIDTAEYILFYTKSKKDFQFKKSYVPVGYDENYKFVIVNKNENPEKWKLKPIKEKVLEENGIKANASRKIIDNEAEKKWGKFWKIVLEQLIAEYALKNAERLVSIRDPQKPVEELRKLLEKSKIERDRVFVYQKNLVNGEEPGEGYVINGGALAFYSKKVKNMNGEITSTELLSDFWEDISWAGIAKEGGVKLKEGKKPEKLIRRIIELGTEPGDIVLDYFMGSGTTCAVAHKMGRQYIGVEQLDYEENDAVVRLKNVIAGDQTGISKAVEWKGGGDFIYCKLKELNELFVKRLLKTKKKEDLLKIWNEMKRNGFLSYKVNERLFDEKAEEFGKLSLDEQRQLLIECLDKNHLYVNYSEIEDRQYKVGKEDIAINREFYERA